MSKNFPVKTKWLFIVNATAGGGKTGKKINQLVHSLTKHQFTYDIELTKFPKHATQLAKAALQDDYFNIIAVGGDGTLNEVVNGVMQSEKKRQCRLGLLPEGGGNDFAVNFGLPRNIERSVNILGRGRSSKIDVGKIEDNYFINALGIGFDARVAKYSHETRYLNGLPRYLFSVLRALFDGKEFQAKIILDNYKFNSNFLLISVGNGKSTGGGFFLTPEAKIDDGLLDVCFIGKTNTLRILKLLPAAIKGKHLREPEVNLKQSKKITIETKKKLPIYCDGELPELNDPLHFEINILSQALNFFY